MLFSKFFRKRRKLLIKNQKSAEKKSAAITQKQKNCSHSFQFYFDITETLSGSFAIKYLIIVKYCSKCNYFEKTFINISI